MVGLVGRRFVAMPLQRSGSGIRAGGGSEMTCTLSALRAILTIRRL
jgi:hypothetical protein